MSMLFYDTQGNRKNNREDASLAFVPVEIRKENESRGFYYVLNKKLIGPYKDFLDARAAYLKVKESNDQLQNPQESA